METSPCVLSAAGLSECKDEHEGLPGGERSVRRGRGLLLESSLPPRALADPAQLCRETEPLTQQVAAWGA